MDQGTRHALTVTAQEKDGITLVKMQGSLAATTAEHGMQEMRKIIDAGAKKVVINLADIDYISSGGIRVLMMAHKVLRPLNGEIKIAAAKGMVKEALETSGFDLLNRVIGGHIQLCNTDEEAVAAFNP